MWYNLAMDDMDDSNMEPGFLQAFRFFVITRIVFWIVIGPIMVVVEMAQGTNLSPEQVTNMTLIERLTLPNIAPILALELTLLALLMLPQFHRSLGRRFVPVTLIIALLPLLVGQYWWPSDNPLQTPFVIFFFVMLVFIAWHYPFRYVLVYVVGLTLYQTRFSLALARWPLSVNVGWLVLQAAMMLIVSYVIVQLVAIHREQRAALAEAYERQAAVNRRLKRYAATVEELTISRERNRLARELHDTLAHSLSAATVQLEAVRSLWQLDPPQAQELLDQADATIRRGLVEARRAMQALRASPLQDRGLLEALRDLAESAAEQCGAALDLELPTELEGNVSPAVEQGVYRIAQEALENIVRHAEAATIVVQLRQQPQALTLTVQDDGQGLAADPWPATNGSLHSGLGIRGMQERAGLISGELAIESVAGEGTTVHLAVSLESSRP